MNSRAIRILLILVIAEITSAFEGSMVYAALPAMMRQYGDPGAVGWVVTGYLLVATATAAVGSRLGDLFGRSRLLGIALLLAMLGSVISAFASELSIVVFGRVVQGASAAILPLCFGLVREHLPASHVPFGIGVLAYVLIRYVVSGGSIPGFPFLASIIAIFSGAQLFALGILGEYLGRMHMRTMDRPAYIVRSTTPRSDA